MTTLIIFIQLLQKLIGRGGSSNVYMATHVETDIKLAIKILRNDKEISKSKGAIMLQEEYNKMLMFESHPNILKSYALNTEGILNGEDVMYCVFELAENLNLASNIKNTGGFCEEHAKFYFLQICHAVKYIHSFGIAHMDIKLGNILLDHYFNAKVADFGISVDVSQSYGQTDSIRGTTGYLAPEIINLLPTEEYDAFKADVYSLGICLYVMLFGEFPIKEDLETSSLFDAETIGCITGLKCSQNSKKQWDILSTDLQDLLGFMLSMDADTRPSIDEVLECEWLNDYFDAWSPQEIYEEMKQRKQFIIDNKNS